MGGPLLHLEARNNTQLLLESNTPGDVTNLGEREFES